MSCSSSGGMSTHVTSTFQPYSVGHHETRWIPLDFRYLFLICSEVSGNAHLVAHRILEKLSPADR